MTTTTATAEFNQVEFETKLVATLKGILRKYGGVRESGMVSRRAGLSCRLQEGKAEWKLIRLGYDSRVASSIVHDCWEVAHHETQIGA